MSTVTVRLLGGLGNQMFQYAAGLGVAERHGSKLNLDPSYITFEAHRSYALDVLKVRATVSNRRRVPRWVFDRPALDEAIIKRRFRASVERERAHPYNPEIESAPANAYLIGYWQSEKYLDPVIDQLRRDFQPREIGPKAALMADRIRQTDRSVAVHVRRGDYIDVEQTRTLHGVCPPDYYSRAARLIAERAGDSMHFVFSDDPDWARKNLKLPGKTVIASESHEAHEDLYLISQCTHAIIANSSFSWWGAWLGETGKSIVVAPENWFAEMPLDYSDIVPQRWIRL